MGDIEREGGGARPLDELREQVREAARAASAHELAPKPPSASMVTFASVALLPNWS